MGGEAGRRAAAHPEPVARRAGEGVRLHLPAGPVAHHHAAAHQEDHPGRRGGSALSPAWPPAPVSPPRPLSPGQALQRGSPCEPRERGARDPGCETFPPTEDSAATPRAQHCLGGPRGQATGQTVTHCSCCIPRLLPLYLNPQSCPSPPQHAGSLAQACSLWMLPGVGVSIWAPLSQPAESRRRCPISTFLPG